MGQQIIYDARDDGMLELMLHAIWLPCMILLCMCASSCYAVWSAERNPTSFSGRRFARYRAKGLRGPWNSKHPYLQVIGSGIFFAAAPVSAMIVRHEAAVRLSHHNYREWSGILTADVISNAGGRRPTYETDMLTIAGMQFKVTCWEAPGRHRIGESGVCRPFNIGDWLIVLYVPLANERYQLEPLQIIRLH